MSEQVKAILATTLLLGGVLAFFVWAATLPPDQTPVEVRVCAHIMCLGERW